jgi:hypothetical protein
MPVLANLLISASIIALTVWLSKTYPLMAGFIVALPITTMLVLPLSYVQNGSVENTALLAKGIFVAIPVSLTFFLPFLFSTRFGLSFWQSYGLGCVLLALGFFVHRALTQTLFQSGA